MPINSILDIIKIPITKYTVDILNKDVCELKQHILSGIASVVKIHEFDKLMKYIIKSIYK